MSEAWPTVTLGSVLTEIQPGFASGQHNSEGQGIPHFRPMNVSTDGRIERSVTKYVAADAGRTDLRLRRGDVVFNNTNSPELVGKTAVFEDEDSPAFSNHMTRLRVDGTRLDPRFAALRLHHAWREGWFAAHCNNHVSQASIGRDVLQAFEIALPPLEVQRGIASLSAVIDGHRSSASRHLSGASAAVGRFRQAVLAAACSGRLTADWRHAHARATSAVPRETPRKKRRDNREQLTELELPELPSTYAVTTLGAATTRLDYGTSKKCDMDTSGVPVLRMGNVQDARLVLNDLKFCPLDNEIERLMLQDGDLLFNRTNSPELVGKAAVFHETTPMSFASYLIRVRFDPEFADSEFVNFWINSARGRMWSRQVKTDGVSQSNINGTKLASMPLPLPPAEEQREIVRRASQLLQRADAVRARIDAAAEGIDRTPQRFLAKALRGELLLVGSKR